MAQHNPTDAWLRGGAGAMRDRRLRRQTHPTHRDLLADALEELEDDRDAAEADMLADRFRDEGW